MTLFLGDAMNSFYLFMFQPFQWTGQHWATLETKLVNQWMYSIRF